MPGVIVIGAGLAGLATAAALGASGFHVDLFETRPFPGGRAASYRMGSGEGEEEIDNCQHVLLGCFHNLLDLYRRMGVEDRIHFYREFYFVEPGGRTSVLRPGSLPAPLHFAGSFAALRFLGAADKLSIARGLLSLSRERARRTDLDRITMLEWLREKRQTPRAIERFWRQVLVSAVNEELDKMAASYGFQVMAVGFLGGPAAAEMGTAAVPLSRLYEPELLHEMGDIMLHLRTPVEHVVVEQGRVKHIIAGGLRRSADYYVSCVPFERMGDLLGDIAWECAGFEHSPITGIHLWFDRRVMDLPQATLLDRTIQWAFNKRGGRYVQLVVSASAGLVEMSRADIIALAVRELAEFFPAAGEAVLEKAHVVKEIRATFSARPGLESRRPPAKTAYPNLFLAGDWTRTGWPATMEGAVRSGYLAAEAVTEAAGEAQRYVI